MTQPSYQFRVPDELMIALGRFTYGASYLEVVLGAMYMRLLTPDLDLARRVVADATMQWLIDHTRALVHYRFPAGTDRDSLDEWLTRVSKARSKRNQIVHSGWYVTMNGSEICHGLTRASVRGNSFRTTAEVVSPEELHAVAFELEQVGLEGVALMTPVIALLGPFVP